MKTLKKFFTQFQKQPISSSEHLETVLPDVQDLEGLLKQMASSIEKSEQENISITPIWSDRSHENLIWPVPGKIRLLVRGQYIEFRCTPIQMRKFARKLLIAADDLDNRYHRGP